MDKKKTGRLADAKTEIARKLAAVKEGYTFHRQAVRGRCGHMTYYIDKVEGVCRECSMAVKKQKRRK